MLNKGAYDPVQEEPGILKYWLDGKFFKPEFHAQKGLLSEAEMRQDDRETFCVINPPPNAYMRPHIGNVSGYAYQDVMLRFNRMLGKKVLGQPGKDHAGIQGEVVVEKIFIEKEGKGKLEMGREEFYKKAYEHFINIMPRIMADEQRIGLSSDYDRNVFTLDPRIVDTILGTFIKMFQDKRVYKGVRIVNWDPKAKTTLADIDTERIDRESELVYVKYPLIKNKAWALSFYDQEALNMVRLGTKSIETRALNPEEKDRFFGDIKTGDLIIAVERSGEGVHHVYKKAGSIEVFKNLEEAFIKIEWSKVFGRNLNSLQELREIYEGLKSGYADLIDKNGLVAIELLDLTEDEYISVATTRAETMLGDTAVTVNPLDPRYSGLIGNQVLLPIVNRPIPIISSVRVDKEFGTGAVKLTPAHAYDDYVIMNEWNASNPTKAVGYINIIDKQAQMAGPIPQKYLGLATEHCRQVVKGDLGNLVYKTEKIEQSIMIGERSKAVVEQIMSSQWFLDVEKLKEPAIKAVEKGEVKIHPGYMTKKYLNWMNNLRDWPVSRSLWWGYRIPVWYKGEITETIDEKGQIVQSIAGEKVVDINDAVNKGLAAVGITSPQEGWIQDNDVFDTWFSSGQWPYATLKANGLLDVFYPTQVMETAYDILELWVSRMIMLGIYHEGKAPFKDVYLHGLVKAPDGQKMSKSKNNVIEPDSVIEKFGADSLRLLYLVGNKAGAGYPVSYEKLEGYKRFLNKIWNASKFVMGIVGELDPNQKPDLDPLDIQEINKVIELSKRINSQISKFRLGLAAEELYQMFWHEFCDLYLEQIKPRVYTRDREGNPINTSQDELKSMASAKWSVVYILKVYLRLLHPFVPFITERIWQEMPKIQGESTTIMYEKWPE